MGGKRASSRLRNLKADGEELKRLLSELGWAQKEFAEHVGVREATVSDWCRGKKEPPKVVLLYLRLRRRMSGLRLDAESGKEE